MSHQTLPVRFQLLTGVWSPADQRYTMIVQDDFTHFKEAQKAFEAVKDDPTLVLLEVRERILRRATEGAPPPPTWATVRDPEPAE